MQRITKILITITTILCLSSVSKIATNVHANSDPYYINDVIRVKNNVNQVRKIYPNNTIGKLTPLKLSAGTKLTAMGTNHQYYVFTNVTQPRPYAYGIPIKDCTGSYAKEIARDDQIVNQRVIDRYIYHPSYYRQYGKYRNGSDKNYAKQAGLIRYHTLKDLNQDRHKYHAKSLKEDRSDLDNLASIRARQIYDRPSHYDHHGQATIFDDAKKLKLSTYSSGEAEGENFAVDHFKKHDTGKKIASRNNNMFMYHDWKPFGRLERNGHRHNILNHQFKYVGIGVYVHHRNVIIAEEFEGQ